MTVAATPAAAAPPANARPPLIQGSPFVGQTLHASGDSWDGTQTGVSYLWRRCADGTGTNCADIGGASSPAYTVTSGDLGKFLVVRATATNGDGSTASDSAPVLVPIPVSNVTPPMVAGTPVVGSQLISIIGTWAGSGPIYLNRQWQRCPHGTASCADVPGAVYESYPLGPADVGNQMRVLAHAHNAGGSMTGASALTAPVTTGTAARPIYGFPAAPPGGPTALAATFTAPSKAKLRRALAGKVGVRVECTQPCKIVTRLKVSKAVSRKWRVPRTVAKRTKTLAAPGHTTVRPRFAKKTQKRLAHVKKLVTTLVAEARDGAGKLGSRRSKKLTLVR